MLFSSMAFLLCTAARTAGWRTAPRIPSAAGLAVARQGMGGDSGNRHLFDKAVAAARFTGKAFGAVTRRDKIFVYGTA